MTKLFTKEVYTVNKPWRDMDSTWHQLTRSSFCCCCCCCQLEQFQLTSSHTNRQPF